MLRISDRLDIETVPHEVRDLQRHWKVPPWTIMDRGTGSGLSRPPRTESTWSEPRANIGAQRVLVTRSRSSHERALAKALALTPIPPQRPS